MWEEVKRQPANLEMATPKRARIRRKDSVSIAFSWLEDQDASINQSINLNYIVELECKVDNG